MSDYYVSPAESYQKSFKDSYAVKQEIDCIELDDDYVFWLAIVDAPTETPRMLEALTEVKQERYRIVDRSHLVDLPTASAYSLKEGDIAWNVKSIDDYRIFGWVFADPETVSGGMREKYQTKDYVIQENGAEYSITLIYFWMDSRE